MMTANELDPADPLFTDEALAEAEENDPLADDTPADDPADRMQTTTDARAFTANMFKDAAAAEKAAEVERLHRARVTALIGAKNLEKLEIFGYEVLRVTEDLA